MKKLTANQKEYKKQVRRIQNIISRAKRLGYTFTEEFHIPEMPKRVTKKAIESLKEIKPITIYKKALYKGISALEQRRIVKRTGGRKSYLKVKEREMKYEELYKRIEEIDRPFGKLNIRFIRSMLLLNMGEMRERYTGKELNKYLDDHEKEILYYIQCIKYDYRDEKANEYYVKLNNLLIS